jgi:hypothetical protein
MYLIQDARQSKNRFCDVCVNVFDGHIVGVFRTVDFGDQIFATDLFFKASLQALGGFVVEI